MGCAIGSGGQKELSLAVSEAAERKPCDLLAIRGRWDGGGREDGEVRGGRVEGEATTLREKKVSQSTQFSIGRSLFLS